MKMLLIVQSDPRHSPEFAGRLIDALRSHGHEVLPYARLEQMEAVTLSQAGSRSERRVARVIRDEIRSCDALMFVQSTIMLPGSFLNSLILVMEWFVHQRRPVITACNTDFASDWPASEVDYSFEWERDEDLHEYVASREFAEAVAFLRASAAHIMPLQT